MKLLNMMNTVRAIAAKAAIADIGSQ